MAKIDAEKVAATSAAALKKIVAGKGRLEGNFYLCAASGKGSIPGLVITLLSRDPKGNKAFQLGKALRKELRSTKQARGRVLVEPPKLILEKHAGNIDSGLASKLLKQIAEQNPALRLAKKAVFKAKDQSLSEAESDSGAEAAAGLSEADFAEQAEGLTSAELAELYAEQEALGSLTERLEGFLSEAMDDDALAEQNAAQLDKTFSALQAAQQSDNDDEVRRLRNQLAQQMWVGEDPMPAPGERLSEAMQQTLELSLESAKLALGEYLSEYKRRMNNLYTEVLKMDEELREANQVAIMDMVTEIRQAAQRMFAQMELSIRRQRI